ncbi:flavin reductase family protein [Actinosynnema sp. NPDC050436]|uniref:flavin reductase family protein n=1 Tax=Actinosynnema sp. NPDC050436 TaxID=3155659 RepID=UPI0033D6E7C7
MTVHETAPVLEETTLRDAMSRFATGVAVVTVGGEHAHGMTANAFTCVSLEPPLVLCCVSRRATMHTAIDRAGRFAVSVMRGDQERTARYFADKRRPRGGAQFDVVDCTPGPHTGAPLLSGALAWLECDLAQWYEGGDHTIFLGRVLGCGRGPDSPALLFYDRGFHRI